MDNEFRQKFEAAVQSDLGQISLYDSAPDVLSEGLRHHDLTQAEAVDLIAQMPWRREWEKPLVQKCLRQLSFWGGESDLDVAIMNVPRLFHMLSDNERWRIRDRVLEDPELLKQVGVGWVGGRHINDWLSNDWLVKQAPFTHSLECIQDAGDDPAGKADAYLYGRISQSLGPEEIHS